MRIFIFFILFTSITHAANQDIYSFSSSSEAARFHTLTNEVRCVVCQSQSIADSNAPLANDLREKIYRMILAKQSNDEIKNYLVKRYGDYILLEPQVSKLTLMLWLFPLAGILFIFIILFRGHLFRGQVMT